MVIEDSRMHLEILGPWLAAPVPGTRGACSSYLVSYRDSFLLLDCGPGTPGVLQERCLTDRIDAIVISHMDSDHVLGLVPFANLMRSRGILSGEPSKRIRLYLPEEDGRITLSSLEAVWSDEASENADPYPDVFEIVEYSDADRLHISGLEIEFARTRHHRPCYSPKLTANSNGNQRTFVYSADTGYSMEMEDHARAADLFLCEATMPRPDPRWTEGHGHLTGEMAGSISRSAEVGRLILTHLSSDEPTNLKNLEAARRTFDGPVELAKAGMIYRV